MAPVRWNCHDRIGLPVGMVKALRRCELTAASRDRVYENAYEIEIKNAKKVPVIVTVREFLPGEWKVEVPPEGSAKLEYRVRLSF